MKIVLDRESDQLISSLSRINSFGASQLIMSLCFEASATASGRKLTVRWEEGDDLEAMHQMPIEYTRRASRAREPLIQPNLSLSQMVNKIGIRKLIRQGFGRRIIEKISRRELVKASTYRDYERRIEEYARRRKRQKHSL